MLDVWRTCLGCPADVSGMSGCPDVDIQMPRLPHIRTSGSDQRPGIQASERPHVRADVWTSIALVCGSTLLVYLFFQSMLFLSPRFSESALYRVQAFFESTLFSSPLFFGVHAFLGPRIFKLNAKGSHFLNCTLILRPRFVLCPRLFSVHDFFPFLCENNW